MPRLKLTPGRLCMHQTPSCFHRLVFLLPTRSRQGQPISLTEEGIAGLFPTGGFSAVPQPGLACLAQSLASLATWLPPRPDRIFPTHRKKSNSLGGGPSSQLFAAVASWNNRARCPFRLIGCTWLPQPGGGIAKKSHQFLPLLLAACLVL